MILPLRLGTESLNAGKVFLCIPVREVNACDVDARGNDSFENLRIVGGRAKGGDNLCTSAHNAVPLRLCKDDNAVLSMNAQDVSPMSSFDTKFKIATAILYAFALGSLVATITFHSGYTNGVIVRLSALPMLIFWFCWMLFLSISEGTTRMSRALATLGLGLLIEHVLIAFYLAHDWSHEAAFDHTDEVSGFGFGIWVNYAVVLLWTIDVLWQWLHIASYLRRPRWLAIGVLTFYAFIMFNATVVYGHDVFPWIGAALFSILGFRLYLNYREPHVPGEPL